MSDCLDPDCLKSVRQILAAARFAAERHATQRRKGRTAEPYVNHLLEVAELLARTADQLDTNLIVAALLHDAIEDVGVSREEIAARFGEDVAALVAEVTDDKSLPKETRKALQVENAPRKSPRAQALGAADKIANVRSIVASPPANWSFERRVEYVRWARQVVGRYDRLNGRLAAEFQQASAELQEWEKSGGTNDFF
ncbi:MAG: HD domain-containing protein [Bryobacteraceae bacterium]|jgi:(p)ppGpp synthase/HD superfamily hydrolase